MKRAREQFCGLSLTEQYGDQKLEIAIISMSTGLNVKAIQQQEPPQYSMYSFDIQTSFSSTAFTQMIHEHVLCSDQEPSKSTS